MSNYSIDLMLWGLIKDQRTAKFAGPIFKVYEEVMSILSETPFPLTPTPRDLIKARRTAKFGGPRGTILPNSPTSKIDSPKEVLVRNRNSLIRLPRKTLAEALDVVCILQIFKMWSLMM